MIAIGCPLASSPTFGWYFTSGDAGFSSYATSTVCGLSFRVTVVVPGVTGLYTFPSTVISSGV